jgi:hypothetical protein
MSDSGSRLEEARAGNIMGKAKVEANAQADYYTLMTRNAKLTAAKTAGVITDAEEKAINSLGDLEKWELKALARLYKLGDNSPELLQYLHITSSATREEVAKKLARKQYKKQLVEGALSKLIAPSEIKANIDATSAATRTAVAANAFGL